MGNFKRRFRASGLLACLLIPAGMIAAQEAKLPAADGNVVVKRFPVKASQGVAVDETYFYAISNTHITKHDKRSGEQIGAWSADRSKPTESHFTHLNSGTVIGDTLYCAHSRFPTAPNDCTIELFRVGGAELVHEATIPLPDHHGSLTWIDRSADGAWWMCYAVYGKGNNKQTKLVKYHRQDRRFVEEKEWFFPEKVVAEWGRMSCSGGSWGPDGKLYTTGHDDPKAHVLKLTEAGKLEWVRTETDLGLFGQAIAWDRFSKDPVLWGIVKNRHISKTRITLGD